MNLLQTYRNYIEKVIQWSIRLISDYINHLLQSSNTPIDFPKETINVSKTKNTEYLYLRLINSCPGFYYVLSQSQQDDLLITTITNKISNGFEIINVNTTPI